MTRAFGHLALGEWSRAWQLHPLAPLLALELGLGWLFWGLKLLGLELRWLWSRLDELLLSHVIVLGALWLGRLATGTLPW